MLVDVDLVQVVRALALAPLGDVVVLLDPAGRDALVDRERACPTRTPDVSKSNTHTQQRACAVPFQSARPRTSDLVRLTKVSKQPSSQSERVCVDSRSAG